MQEEIENGVMVDGVLMEKIVEGRHFARCFHCGRFFTPTIIDMELQLFCSDECEKKDNEHWEKLYTKAFAIDNDTNRK